MWCKDGVTVVLWNPSVHPRVLPERELLSLDRCSDRLFDSSSSHLFIAAQSAAVRKLSHIRGQLTTISHRVVVFDWRAWQLFLSLSFCHFLCITGAAPLLCPERREMLKMWWFTVHSPRLQLSLSHQWGAGRRKKKKLGGETGVRCCFFLPSQTFFMRAIVTVDLCWTGVLTLSLHSCLKGCLSSACVCVCVHVEMLACLYGQINRG